VFGIFLFPSGVLLISELIFLGVGRFVVFDILGGNSDFFFSFSKSGGGIFSKFGGGNDSGLVVGNFGFHVTNEFFT
jgi:hypothetical protein